MGPIAIDDLLITLNGTFVRSREKLCREDIDRLFESARSNEDPDHDVLLEIYEEKIGDSRASALVYFSKRDAYFLADEDVYDTIASYFIFIQNSDNEFCIFRKSCAPIGLVLERKYEVAGFADLIKTFDDSKSQIQKLSAREMGVSDKGIRFRSYEAPDLKGHMSPHAAGRSIPRFTTVRSKDDVKSISLNSGRINQISDRVNIPTAAKWVRDVFLAMNSAKANNSFFSNFAQKVELAEVLTKAHPSCILFERSSIEDHLDEKSIQLHYSVLGKYRKLKNRSLKRLLRAFDNIYEVDNHGNSTHVKGARIRINRKTMTPEARTLQRLKIWNGKKYITFQSWIVDNGYYVISFNRPEYIYMDRSCFMDRTGKSEIESVLSSFVAVPELDLVTSEKGQFVKGQTKFEDNSIFSVIENTHAKDDFLFCDDLGNEWADHVSVRTSDACISFIHSKYAKTTGSSASAFHELVGQAIKNLGNMHLTHNTFSYKMNSKFKKKYSNTQIERTRNGDPSLANSEIKSVLSDHRLHRKCIIATNSVSLKSIHLEFSKIKKGKPVAGNVVQLLWIVSSFIHAATGAAVVPVIYCRP